ncbi:uncharacterized protein [Dermacentor andersoni]|uniref:uncharacterized protein n=1 Tax=Dermacentor andersoni TaxID=34620 RepID=UPI003B3B13DF
MDTKKHGQFDFRQNKGSTSASSSKSAPEGSEANTPTVSLRSSGSDTSRGQTSHDDKWTVILGLMVIIMVTVCASYLAWAVLVEKEANLPSFPSWTPDNATDEGASNGSVTDEFGTATSEAVRSKNPLTNAMVCHYSFNEAAVHALAPDGLCDYAFCEQFYLPSHQGFVEGPGPDQESFMMAASKHSMTEYGISFPFLAISMVRYDLSSEAAPASVSRYWAMRFYHYGFVTMDLGRSSTELKNVLEVLQMAKKLVTPHTKRDGRPSYTAIAWNEKDTSAVTEAVKLMRNVLMPDFIIVHGHRVYLGKNPTPELVSAPTNIFVEKHASGIVQTLGEAVKSLKELSRMRIPAALSLSVTMSAYTYYPKSLSDLQDGADAMFREANFSTTLPFAAYEHVCGYPGDFFFYRERYNSTYHVRYRYEDGRLLLWDTEGSLREKLCRIKRNSTNVPYSLAAYDLDWDDHEDTCSFANWFGAYSRVKMVRVLSEFFHYGFHTKYDEADCLVIGDEF